MGCTCCHLQFPAFAGRTCVVRRRISAKPKSLSSSFRLLRHAEDERSPTMITRIELSKPVQPLHLYRHLLREASYLPRICRPIVDQSIRARFEAVQNSVASLKRRQPFRTSDSSAPTPSDRLGKAFDDGVRQLRALRAVNLGDGKRMSRLFKHVFGRLGKRRRALVNQFLQSSPPANSAELQSRLKDASERGAHHPPVDEQGRPIKPVVQDKWNMSRLRPYIISQLQQQNRAEGRTWQDPITYHNPSRSLRDIPSTNVWGNPMPQSRIRHAEEKFWKLTINRLSPPISKSEWERLSAVTQGRLAADIYGFLPRRIIARPATGDDLEEKPSSWSWTENASWPVSAVEYPVSWRQWRLTAQEDHGPYGRSRQLRPSTFSPRRLRREYGRIFQATPYVEEGPKMSVHWGAARPLNIPDASPAQARVFQNIDTATQASANKGQRGRRRK